MSKRDEGRTMLPPEGADDSTSVWEYEARKVVWVLDAAVHSIVVEKGKELEHSSLGEEIFSAA
jgi:hypothetical protein